MPACVEPMDTNKQETDVEDQEVVFLEEGMDWGHRFASMKFLSPREEDGEILNKPKGAGIKGPGKEGGKAT